MRDCPSLSTHTYGWVLQGGRLGLRWPPFYGYKQQSNRGRLRRWKGFRGGRATRAERVGRSFALRLGRLIENKKIERGMGRLHCGGRFLIGGHNNQIKVGIDVGGDVGEERRPGRNMWEGVVSLNWASN